MGSGCHTSRHRFGSQKLKKDLGILCEILTRPLLKEIGKISFLFLTMVTSSEGRKNNTSESVLYLSILTDKVATAPGFYNLKKKKRDDRLLMKMK